MCRLLMVNVCVFALGSSTSCAVPYTAEWPNEFCVPKVDERTHIFGPVVHDRPNSELVGEEHEAKLNSIRANASTQFRVSHFTEISNGRVSHSIIRRSQSERVYEHKRSQENIAEHSLVVESRSEYDSEVLQLEATVQTCFDPRSRQYWAYAYTPRSRLAAYRQGLIRRANGVIARCGGPKPVTTYDGAKKCEGHLAEVIGDVQRASIEKSIREQLQDLLSATKARIHDSMEACANLDQLIEKTRSIPELEGVSRDALVDDPRCLEGQRTLAKLHQELKQWSAELDLAMDERSYGKANTLLSQLIHLRPDHSRFRSLRTQLIEDARSKSSLAQAELAKLLQQGTDSIEKKQYVSGIVYLARARKVVSDIEDRYGELASIPHHFLDLADHKASVFFANLKVDELKINSNKPHEVRVTAQVRFDGTPVPSLPLECTLNARKVLATADSKGRISVAFSTNCANPDGILACKLDNASFVSSLGASQGQLGSELVLDPSATKWHFVGRADTSAWLVSEASSANRQFRQAEHDLAQGRLVQALKKYAKAHRGLEALAAKQEGCPLERAIHSELHREESASAFMNSVGDFEIQHSISETSCGSAEGIRVWIEHVPTGRKVRHVSVWAGKYFDDIGSSGSAWFSLRNHRGARMEGGLYEKRLPRVPDSLSSFLDRLSHNLAFRVILPTSKSASEVVLGTPHVADSNGTFRFIASSSGTSIRFRQCWFSGDVGDCSVSDPSAERVRLGGFTINSTDYQEIIIPFSRELNQERAQCDCWGGCEEDDVNEYTITCEGRDSCGHDVEFSISSND